MKINLQKLALRGILDILRPLTLLDADRAATRQFFIDMGWDIEVLLGGDIAPLLTVLTNVRQALSSAEQNLALGDSTSVASLGQVRNALQTTRTLLNSVGQLATLAAGSPTAGQFYADVLQKLVGLYLLTHADGLYMVGVTAGFIVGDTSSIRQNGKQVKFTSRVPVLSFDKLLDFLKNPVQQIGAEYWPDGVSVNFATVQSTHEVGQRLLPRLAGLLSMLGLPAARRNAGPTGAGLTPDQVATLESSLQISKRLPIGNDDEVELGLHIGLLAATQAGPGVYLAPHGAVNLHEQVYGWLVDLAVSGQIDGLTITRAGTQFSGNGALTNFEAGLRATEREKPSTQDNQALGNQTGSRLQLGRLELGANLKAATVRFP